MVKGYDMSFRSEYFLRSTYKIRDGLCRLKIPTSATSSVKAVSVQSFLTFLKSNFSLKV